MSLVPPEVVGAIEGSRRVLLFAHVYPDGDVLGSQLGLGLALRGGSRAVTFACAHPVPDPFHFLPGAADVQQWKAGRHEFDLVVALDCPDQARLGGLRGFSTSTTTVTTAATGTSTGWTRGLRPPGRWSTT